MDLKRNLLSSQANQNEANIFITICLQYEYFVSMSAGRLMNTNSLCTSLVPARGSRLRVNQIHEKMSFLAGFFW